MGSILETERLILRDWRDEDAESLFKYASDDRVGPAAGWLPHKDVGYSRAVIRTLYAKDEVYAICLKGGENEPIGNISLTLEGSPERPLSKGEGEIGYWLGYPFWGQGIASEAVKEVLYHGFVELGLKRIYSGYFKGNNNSKKVQYKCGFKPHHVNTASRVYMLGETRIEYINCITRTDFLATKKSQN